MEWETEIVPCERHEFDHAIERVIFECHCGNVKYFDRGDGYLYFKCNCGKRNFISIEHKGNPVKFFSVLIDAKTERAEYIIECPCGAMVEAEDFVNCDSFSLACKECGMKFEYNIDLEVSK